jgi:hypothetical protein
MVASRKSRNIAVKAMVASGTIGGIDIGSKRSGITLTFVGSAFVKMDGYAGSECVSVNSPAPKMYGAISTSSSRLYSAFRILVGGSVNNN